MIRFNVIEHGYVVEKATGERGFTVRVQCPFRSYWVWASLDAKTSKRALKLAPAAAAKLLRQCAADVDAEALRLLDMHASILKRAAKLEAVK